MTDIEIGGIYLWSYNRGTDFFGDGIDRNGSKVEVVGKNVYYKVKFAEEVHPVGKGLIAADQTFWAEPNELTPVPTEPEGPFVRDRLSVIRRLTFELTSTAMSPTKLIQTAELIREHAERVQETVYRKDKQMRTEHSDPEFF